MQNTLQVDDRVARREAQQCSQAWSGRSSSRIPAAGSPMTTRAESAGPIGKAFQFIGVLPDTSTEHLIKRVDRRRPGIAWPAATRRAGSSSTAKPLDETSYLSAGPDGVQVQPSADQIRCRRSPWPIFFVMGDNRDHSRDSRCHLNDMQAGAAKGQNAFVSQRSGRRPRDRRRLAARPPAPLAYSGYV